MFWNETFKDQRWYHYSRRVNCKISYSPIWLSFNSRLTAETTMGNTFALSNAQMPRRRWRRRTTDTVSPTNGTVTNTSVSAMNCTKKSKRKKKDGKRMWTKREFYSTVKSSPAGAELLSCSFGTWCKRQRNVCGFSDRADYTSNRQPLLKLNGSPTRADTTEGRYFQCHFK